MCTSSKSRPGRPRPSRPGEPTRKAEPVAASDPKWSKDGKSIYYITDKGSDFRRLVRHDLGSGAEVVLTASIASDIEEYDLSDDGQIIAVVANQEGIDELRVFEAATRVEPAMPALPHGRISGLKFRPGSHELGFTLSSAQAGVRCLFAGSSDSAPR